ncbi:MAG: hypothetical protein ACKVQS_14130 [Fimbriimonadaceae bacterium]
MAGIAKLVKILLTLAALVTSVETLARIVRFAWALVIKLGGMLKKGAMFGPKFQFAR